jgi:hypothetical protein
MTIDLVYCRSRRRHRRYLAVTAGAVGELNAYMFMRDSGCKGPVAIYSLLFPYSQRHRRLSGRR